MPPTGQYADPNTGKRCNGGPEIPQPCPPGTCCTRNSPCQRQALDYCRCSKQIVGRQCDLYAIAFVKVQPARDQGVYLPGFLISPQDSRTAAFASRTPGTTDRRSHRNQCAWRDCITLN